MGAARAVTARPVRAALWASEDRRNVALAITAGLVIRVVLIVAYAPSIQPDSAEYLGLAHRLGSLHLTGYDGVRTPGYPLMLFALGYSPTTAWWAQAVLGLLTTGLLYRLVRQLGGSPTMAFVAALLYTTSLEVLSIERQVLTEALTTFLLTVAGSICVALVGPQGRRNGLVALLAVTLAYLCLVRPDALLVAIYLALSVVAVWYRREADTYSRRSLIRPALTMMLPLVIALVAWATVNKEASGVMSVSTVLGHNMIDHMAPYVGVQPGRDHEITSVYVRWRARVEAANGGSYANTSWAAEPSMERASHLSAPHVSSRLLSVALGAIESHPWPYITSSLEQWPKFWLPPNYAYDFSGGAGSSLIHAVWKVQRAAQLIIAALFLLLCTDEAVRRVRRRRPALMNAPMVLLAGAVLLGTLSPIFLAYGATGRYGSVYYPLFLAVTFALASPALRSFSARRRSRVSSI